MGRGAGMGKGICGASTVGGQLMGLGLQSVAARWGYKTLRNHKESACSYVKMRGIVFVRKSRV